MKKLQAAKKEMAKAWWYYMTGIYELTAKSERDPSASEVEDAWNEYIETQKGVSNLEKLVKKINAARLRLAKALWWFKDGLHGDYCNFEGITDEELHSEAKAELFFARRALEELLETEGPKPAELTKPLRDQLRDLDSANESAVKPLDISDLGPAAVKAPPTNSVVEKLTECDYCGAATASCWERPCGNSCYHCGKNHDFNTCRQCNDYAERSCEEESSVEESCCEQEACEQPCRELGCCLDDAPVDDACEQEACEQEACEQEACSANQMCSAKDAPVNRRISFGDMVEDDGSYNYGSDLESTTLFADTKYDDFSIETKRKKLDDAIERAEVRCRERVAEMKHQLSIHGGIW